MMDDYKDMLEKDLKVGRANDFKVVLVEANPKKGFNYSYLVYIPNEPQNILMMDCLNDYEIEIPEGYVENFDGIEEVYSLFEDGEVIINDNTQSKKGNEENKEQTLDRMYYRVEKGFIALQNIISMNDNIPAIVPLIPGFFSDEFGKTESQLDKDVIEKTAPQIKAMIEDARKIIEERSGIEISDKVIPLGHSKSATFANNFSAYYPEMCEASILGGGDFGTLPVDKIVLQIVDDNQITENEQFSLINGIVTKRITQADFDRIMQEYNDTKRDYQDEITINEDETYNLPMNFPVGISDIEHYRDLSVFPDGKEGYIKELMSISKMIFVGEQEETRPGHYAYKDGITKEGTKVKAGDDINILKDKGISVDGIEVASMHNRVLEYIAASNVLFGRSSNERLNSYMQLYSILDMSVQSKIYEDVGHCRYNYSKEKEKEPKGIFSKSIYESDILKKDISLYYTGAISGEIPQLDDTKRAEMISPIPQLVRRCIAAGYDMRFLEEKLPKDMIGIFQKHTEKDKLVGENIDRVYDEMSADDIYAEFQKLREKEIIQEGKNGLVDCMKDDKVRVSTEQDAAKTVKEAILGKEKLVDKTAQEK